MSEEKLKPCPFCGGNVTIKRRNRYGWITFVIYCLNDSCFLNLPENRFSFKDKNNAIEAWNRRAK